MNIQARPLNDDDLDLICRHREQIFRESGRDEDCLRLMAPGFRAWLVPRLRDGSYYGFLLHHQDRPLAAIGMMEIDWPPHPAHPRQDKRGYVLNLYVEPDSRKQGLARQLMRLAEEEFARRHVQFAILHATAEGKRLYDDIGWQATNEMSKHISAPPD
jgi:ribosomal protein S18 acetylase RimI-like enzyme